MSDTDPTSRPVRGVPALIATIVGAAAMAWSFPTGISAALDGSGSGALPYEIVFLVAAALVLAGLVFGIVNLVRGRSRGIAIATILVALVPAVAIVVLRVAAVS